MLDAFQHIHISAAGKMAVVGRPPLGQIHRHGRTRAHVGGRVPTLSASQGVIAGAANQSIVAIQSLQQIGGRVSGQAVAVGRSFQILDSLQGIACGVAAGPCARFQAHPDAFERFRP